MVEQLQLELRESTTLTERALRQAASAQSHAAATQRLSESNRIERSRWVAYKQAINAAENTHKRQRADFASERCEWGKVRRARSDA